MAYKVISPVTIFFTYIILYYLTWLYTIIKYLYLMCYTVKYENQYNIRITLKF